MNSNINSSHDEENLLIPFEFQFSSHFINETNENEHVNGKEKEEENCIRKYETTRPDGSELI